jgi:phosphoribosylglycinamide formyltransferase-1
MSQLVPKKIAVLLSGGGTNLQSLIDNIGDINAKIDIVISNRKVAYGLERAKLNNIDTLYINQKDYESVEAFNDEIINELTKRNIDLVVLAGYLKILSKRFIETYKNRIMNVHPSLIPSFCGNGFYGLRVHEEVINYGVKISGATVHFVTDDTDAGPIILQDSVQVDDNDTAESLQKKVLQIEHTLLPKAVKLFCEEKLHIENRKVIVK